VGDLPGWRRKSDLDDSDQTFKTLEVFTVPGYQRKVFSKSGRGNQQVCEPAPGLASVVYHGGVYSAIRPSRSNVEWHRVKRGLGALQAILSSSAFGAIRRGRRACGKLSQRDSRYRHFFWKPESVKSIKINNDRCVEKPSGEPIRHGRESPDPRLHRDLS
jgi:hypothetical protein